MSDYAYNASPWRLGGYNECLRDQLYARQKNNEDIPSCPHPILEHFLVGTSIVVVVITLISLIVYSLVEDESRQRKLKSTDMIFHAISGIFLIIGAAMFVASTVELAKKCGAENDAEDHYLHFCWYYMKVPEKYLAAVTGALVGLLYLFTGVMIKRNENHEVKGL